ncbi:MAG: SPFH domain-containing protein [archaeon]|jgi:regulator of protease activity HflC (stomatin/prohibitin superfamily)
MVGASFKYVVFVVVIIMIAIFLGLSLTYVDFMLSNVFWLILLIIFIYVIWKFDFILQLVDYQRAVIYRFGKVNRVGGPGWTWIWPVIESYAKVDLRTKAIDVPKQDVVTKDGIELKVDAVIYLKVKKDRQSVVNSIIEVEDFQEAARLFVVSAIRDAMGSMQLSEIISNMDIINAQIKENLLKISKDWGVDVDSVEMKDVQIPDVVLDAMHQEKAAVQQKLARMEKALAHKAEIEAVKEAAKDLDANALSYYYIKAIENMSNSKGSKVFFPAEFSKLAQTFSSSELMKASDNTEVGKYKKLLEDYVASAVSKVKDESVKKEKSKPKKKIIKKKLKKKSNN